MDAEKMLACRILEQAIEDYKCLKSNGITEKRYKESRYSIDEIENFFKGEWCSRLLEFVNCSLAGEDILEELKNLDCTY